MYYKNLNFSIVVDNSVATLEDAIKSVWEQLPRNRYFSGEVQWRGINTIHGYIYDNPIFGAVEAFSFDKRYVNIRRSESIFYVEKPVLNSDLKLREGVTNTNSVSSGVHTSVNKLSVEAGTYIITARAQFSESFEEQCNYEISGGGRTLALCRANALNGGGQTPICIDTFSSSTTIELKIFQNSGINRTLVSNYLKAVRLY